MNSILKTSSALAFTFLVVACSSSTDSGNSSGGASSGGSSAAASNCGSRCESAAKKCSGDSSICGQLCATLTESQLTCVEGAGCDQAKQNACLSSGSSSSGGSSSGGGSSSSTSSSGSPATCGATGDSCGSPKDCRKYDCYCASGLSGSGSACNNSKCSDPVADCKSTCSGLGEAYSRVQAGDCPTK